MPAGGKARRHNFLLHGAKKRDIAAKAAISLFDVILFSVRMSVRQNSVAEPAEHYVFHRLFSGVYYV